jgi:hypothetical protein
MKEFHATRQSVGSMAAVIAQAACVLQKQVKPHEASRMAARM